MADQVRARGEDDGVSDEHVELLREGFGALDREPPPPFDVEAFLPEARRRYARHRLMRAADAGMTAFVSFLAGVLSLLAPIVLGLAAGHLVGSTVWGLVVAMVVVANATFWWCRMMIAVLWWVKTGEWDWRRTGVRRSFRVGWPR